MKYTFPSLAIALALVLTGCARDSEVRESTTPQRDTRLNVLAAASLQESFEEIGDAFAQEHPDVVVDFQFGGSSTLVHNLDAGAPADVFASADEANMEEAELADVIEVDTRELFAANKLVGIVPRDNPADVSTLEEANAEGVKLVVCAPQVPCGALSEQLAETAGVTLNPVSEEQQVADVLGKVRSGQADAGLVYATDAALAADDVTTFALEGADDLLNYYPIARTADADSPEAAEDFIEFVMSDAGQDILDRHGFITP